MRGRDRVVANYVNTCSLFYSKPTAHPKKGFQKSFELLSVKTYVLKKKKLIPIFHKSLDFVALGLLLEA
jgi:hypothetical protein